MKKIVELDLSEKDLVLRSFERNGFRTLMEHDIEGIEEDKAPRFNLLYKYEKGKNYFVFISVKRNFPERKIVDISTQMLIIKRRQDVKMVARNNYFDAADEFGNVVHIEMDGVTEPIEILNEILMFKK